MKIIDLSQQLYDNMPVYPGDPEVLIEEIHHLAREGWNLRSISITTHSGTHVNVPYHMANQGLKLDSYRIEDFIGETVIFDNEKDIVSNKGILFRDIDVSKEIAEKIVKVKPKFVSLSSKREFDIEIEKYLLENGIISFENIENTDKLPKRFTFYGVPLSIKEGDGSPVRAFAMVV